MPGVLRRHDAQADDRRRHGAVAPAGGRGGRAGRLRPGAASRRAAGAASVFVYGVTPDVPRAWKFSVRQGSLLARRRTRAAARRRRCSAPSSSASCSATTTPWASSCASAAAASASSASWRPRGSSWASTSTTRPTSRWRARCGSSTWTELSEIDVIYAHAGLADQVERDVKRRCSASATAATRTSRSPPRRRCSRSSTTSWAWSPWRSAPSPASRSWSAPSAS